jgi:hypothetical protein
MSAVDQGVCEKCGQGVHISSEGQDAGEPGRVVCDGCSMPTELCTC